MGVHSGRLQHGSANRVRFRGVMGLQELATMSTRLYFLCHQTSHLTFSGEKSLFPVVQTHKTCINNSVHVRHIKLVSNSDPHKRLLGGQKKILITQNVVATVSVSAGVHKARAGVHGTCDPGSIPLLLATRHLQSDLGLTPVGSEATVIASL